MVLSEEPMNRLLSEEDVEMARILVIDDDEPIRLLISRIILQEGHEVESSGTMMEGVRLAQSSCFDLVLLDVLLPDGNSLEVLPQILASPASPSVIMMTAVGTLDGAELALRTGAWNYLCKPVPLGEFRLQIQRALQFREANKVNQAPAILKRERIVGASPSINQCLELVGQAACSSANVLISGETGVGKEAVAQTIHENSPRSKASFIVVDCSSLPETLVESTLFGHEKGAFTGADQQREGLIKIASGGTLFLDEIGELSLSAQKSFLRVLQEKKFRPVGAVKEVESDFRLIAATNRDLGKMVHAGTFREDLYYRLKTIQIKIPPLRERKEDLRRLISHFMAWLDEQNGMGIKGILQECYVLLESYPWPGNIRELKNTLEGAYLAAGKLPSIVPFHLPSEIRLHSVKKDLELREPSSAAPWMEEIQGVLPIKDFREKMEKKYLSQLVESTKYDTVAASQLAGVSRVRFYEMLRKHQIALKT